MVERISLVLRSALYVSGFFVTLIWLVPAALGIRLSETSFSRSPTRTLGVVPLLLGAAIAVWCFVNFVLRGSGTPAPFDAPRKLVVTGPYCYVRNPMYIGGFFFLIGFALMFAEFSWTLMWYGAALLVAVNLFVLFYEEPTLTRKFGDDYEQYRNAVSRWIPSLRPWHGHKQAATIGQ
jgi:protein-S-isoprenylcysteine O-methyltransferase Ste14